jgi:hypothetical protein
MVMKLAHTTAYRVAGDDEAMYLRYRLIAHELLALASTATALLVDVAAHK